MRIGVIVLAAVLPQGSAPTPAVILGPTSEHLNADDDAQLDRLCASDGKTVWGLQGHSPGMINRDRWYVRAYLTPDRSTTDIRRGHTCEVSAKLPAEQTPPGPLLPVYTAPRTWERDSLSTRSWAQVRVPGSNPDQIRDRRDLNRLFSTTDTLDDETLVAIVALIRSGPVIAPPSYAKPGEPVPRGWTHVESTWPIASIATATIMEARSADVVVLLLDPAPEERSGEIVYLRKRDDKWVVKGLGRWVVD